MDIEYNEARVKDVEIVLFNFEQRVEKLEQQLLHDQYMPNEDEIVQTTINRISADTERYFPTIFKELKKVQGVKDDIM